MPDTNVPTVLARVVGRTHVLVVFVVLYLFDNLVDEMVKKLVGVFVYGATERFIAIAELVDECAEGNSALIQAFLEMYTRERSAEKRVGGVEGMSWEMGAEGWSSFPRSDLRRVTVAVVAGVCG